MSGLGKNLLMIEINNRPSSRMLKWNAIFRNGKALRAAKIGGEEKLENSSSTEIQFFIYSSSLLM